MNLGVITEHAAQNLNRAVRDYFVRVHVEADAGPRLEDVNYEFVVPFALLNFLRSLDDCLCNLLLHQSQLAVGLGGRLFHHAKCADQCRMRAHAGDWVILHRARGLDTVINTCGNFLSA